MPPDPLFVAFLRAINVGGHTVKMAELKSIFESMELADVATLIASGNVMFKAASSDPGLLESRIEAALQKALGYEVVTFLRTPTELREILEHRPFGMAETEGRPLHVGFLKSPPPREAAEAASALRTEVDAVEVHGRELYWLAEAGMGRAKLTGAALEKALGGPTTLRNLNTVRRLAAKYPA